MWGLRTMWLLPECILYVGYVGLSDSRAFPYSTPAYFIYYITYAVGLSASCGFPT